MLSIETRKIFARCKMKYTNRTILFISDIWQRNGWFSSGYTAGNLWNRTKIAAKQPSNDRQTATNGVTWLTLLNITLHTHHKPSNKVSYFFSGLNVSRAKPAQDKHYPWIPGHWYAGNLGYLNIRLSLILAFKISFDEWVAILSAPRMTAVTIWRA